MLASLDADALACALQAIEARLRRADGGAAMEDILEDAANFGDKAHKFWLTDIDPEA